MAKLNNQKGSILLNAIIVTLVMAGMSAVMLQQANTTEKTLRAPRIRAAMIAFEGAVRHRLMQPSTYLGCSSTTGTGTCTIDPLAIQPFTDPDFIETIPGCVVDNDPNATCGVLLQPNPPATNGWNAASRTFNGQIIYQGDEIEVRPNPISFTVPVEVLQDTSFSCPVSRPFFQGYDPVSGAAICRPVQNCPNGAFVKGLDIANLTAQCTVIQSTDEVCPGGAAQQMMRNFNLSSNGQIDSQCVIRSPPSSLFP